jgi:7-cyano-7-deazaguanine synthase
MRREDKAVVLLSGGMDSATTLAIASKRHRIIAVHFNYHQRTEERELWCFNRLCSYYKVFRKIVIDMDFLKDIGGSTLFKGSGSIPKPEFKKGKIPSTYVPFRNGIMLSIAAGIADRCGARYIYIGAVEVDSSGYPDCREEFITRFESAVRAGTRSGDIRVIAPLIRLQKSEIVRKGLRLGVPYKFTWSCYKSNEVPCMSCESCILRMRGFLEANASDPLLKGIKSLK